MTAVAPNKILDPQKILMDTFMSCEPEYEKQYHIISPIDEVMKIDCFGIFRENATEILCLMPSAQAADAFYNPVFNRWAWSNSFPGKHILVFSDPSLYLGSIGASWFISGKDGEDIPAHIANFIASVAQKLNILSDRVVMYGSSMGGFGALMTAAELPKSMAISELPQVDVAKYSNRQALINIEEALLDGVAIDEFSKTHAAQVVVLERFKKVNIIPSFLLITNRRDHGFRLQQSFFADVLEMAPRMSSVGDVAMKVMPDPAGHKTLHGSIIVKLINSAFDVGSEIFYNAR